MNDTTGCCRSKTSLSGSAIIIVLGMMAILMVLGAAFSVNMRVERTGAGNYRYAVATRHLLLAALSRAIDDIDYSITNNTNGTISVDWSVLASTNGLDGASVLWGDAEKYLPAALLSEAKAASPSWLPIDEERNALYAYVVVNVSGFLDANYVGGGSRKGGDSPSEIQLGALSEISDVSKFMDARTNDCRYETLKEFAELQNGYGLVSNVAPRSFVTYSRYLSGSFDGTNINDIMVSLAGDADDIISRKTQIWKAFKASGMSGSDALKAYFALVDYVDADSIPGNENDLSNPAKLTSPYVEPVPMVNEVWCQGTFKFTTNAPGYTCNVRYYFRAECVYPFLYPAFSDMYKFSPTISSTNSTFKPSNTYSNSSDITASPFWSKKILILPFDTTISNLVAGQKFDVDLDFNAKVRLRGVPPGDYAVDELGAPLKLRLSFEAPSPLTASFTLKTEAGWECIDPRMNEKNAMWVESPSNTATTVSNSIGQMNSVTINRASTNTLLDRDIWSVVANKSISHVGELGNIFLGKPLETVRLYSHGTNNYHKIFEHFTTSSNVAAPRKGLVSINTLDKDVLAAVYTNMPIREYDTSTVRLVDPAVIDSIATTVISEGPYTNISDIANADWLTHAAGLAASVTNPPLCDLDIESFIRNSAGLFGTRQQLFLIALAAGPFRVMPGIAAFRGDWLGRSRAVALVWRDPFPDADGKHPCFVRMFKTLGDE